MALPPGMTEKAFRKALSAFAKAVGEDWVLTGPQDLEAYRDEFGPRRGLPDESIASAAIAPASVDEVRAILAIANDFGLPLWPISCGRNYGYGGAAPRLSGSVVLDLKRMNRILELSEANAYALVEPGVSSFDLYRAIKQQGLKLWLDGPSPGWASVIGSTLERGLGHGLLGDRWGQECGMEVVLPDGDLLRTAMGAIPGSETWQQHRWGFGPHLDGLFSQSNLGVVTKMGTWLTPEPPSFIACYVDVHKYDDIVPLADILRRLKQTNIVLNAINIRPRRGPDREGPPAGWRALTSFCGRDPVPDLLLTEAKDALSVIPGVTFEEKRYAAPYDPAVMDWQSKWLAGIPSMSEMSRWEHSGVFASQVIPFSGETVWKRIEVLDEVYRQFGRRYFGSSMNAHHPRSLIALSGVPVKRGDAEFTNASLALARRVLAEAAKHGWGPYREGPDLMDDAMAVYGFADRGLLRLHETLKDALDPKGILAAGKSGVWPKALRKT